MTSWNMIDQELADTIEAVRMKKKGTSRQASANDSDKPSAMPSNPSEQKTSSSMSLEKSSA